MNLTDFGQLVKALRYNSFDDENKRWTRDSLSKKIHLTANQLGRLERGDRKYLDSQTLQLLAESFKLTELEKREFYAAAVGLPDKEVFAKEDADHILRHVISTMENYQFPAYLTDCYLNIIGANNTLINLYQITPDLIMESLNNFAGRNVVNFVYSEKMGYKNIIGSEWRKSTNMVLLFFRRATLKYRHKEYFQLLLKELQKEEQFSLDWQMSHKLKGHLDLSYEVFDYKHPTYGPLSYIATETIISTARGELYLLVYNPANTITVQTFSQIKNNHGNRIKQFGTWPVD